MAAAINMRAPIAKNYRLSVAPSAIGKINHAALCVGQESPCQLWLTGVESVPESDSGPHEKRYCCVGAETPHKRPAKLAGVPRKAGGSKRLQRAVLLRTWLRLGPLTKGQI